MSDNWVLVIVVLPLIALWVSALIEVLRRRDLRGLRAAVWLVALLLVPLVALIAYLVLRPPRAVESSRVGADTDVAEAVVALAERRQRGHLSDDEYLNSLRELRASTPAAQ